MDESQLIGHIAAYIRPALLGDEDLTIGLIGGVVVDAEFRGRGHAKLSFGRRIAFLPRPRSHSPFPSPTSPGATNRRGID